MAAIVFNICLAVVLDQTPAVRESKESPSQPRLILKNEAFLIHAIPTGAIIPGLAVVHTTTATGEMKLLARSDYSMLVVPMGIDRIQIDDTRIAGVAVDKERLYVLKWEGWGGGPAGPYRLLVFRPRDGKLMSTLEIKGSGVPKDAPKVTADKGPLRLHGNGVSCFGTRLEFRGTELIRQAPEKRP
jgi:hypothetical protein